MFTYQLARRLEGAGVTANCLHPGVVVTGFGQNNTRLAGGLFRLFHTLGRPVLLTSEKGARTSIYLASSPAVEGVTGKYYANGREQKSSAESHDATVARRLWEVS